MKLKDLKGFPKKKGNLPEGKGYYRLRGLLYNNALLEIGEMEVEINEKVALEIIKPVMSYKEMEELAYALKTA